MNAKEREYEKGESALAGMGPAARLDGDFNASGIAIIVILLFEFKVRRRRPREGV